MLKVDCLLISNLGDPPSTLLPRNTAENREWPAKRYVFTTQSSPVREVGERDSTQVTVRPAANSSTFIERMTGRFNSPESGR